MSRNVYPRGSGSAPRGGRGQLRLDRDGDIAMDAASAGRGRGRGRGGRGRGGQNSDSNPSSNPARLGEHTVTPATQGDRRGNPSRDRDVGSNDSRGRGGSRGKDTRGRQGGHQDQILEKISVRGWEKSKAIENGTEGCISSLVGFLERKSSARGPPVRIIRSNPSGNDLLITVKPQDVPSILHLDGFTFAGAVLSIKAVEKDSIPETAATPAIPAASQPFNKILEAPGAMKQWIKTFLERRYNQEIKLLDLSSLGTDPDIIASGLFQETSTESKFFPALMAVCDSIFSTAAEKRAAITSVSLASNFLRNVAPVTALAQTLPGIINLDLSNNKFETLKGLEAWRRRFKSLEHLILTNNPLETTTPNYHEDIISWYPNLKILNSTQVRGAPTVIAPQTAAPAVAAAIPGPVDPVLEEQARRNALVLEFSQFTGMNAQYAAMCLEETGWIPAAAEAAFATAKEKNLLPPEAFVP